MISNQALETALAYAKANWFVFPVNPESRVPYHGFTWTSNSTNNPELIKQYAQYFPGCSWAVHLGPSELVVFDIDRHGVSDGFATVQADPELAELWHNVTFRVATPRNGEHWYFKAPPDKLGSKPRAWSGIDVKKGNSYVLLPNSIGHGGKTYSIIAQGAVRYLPENIVLKFKAMSGLDPAYDMYCLPDQKANLLQTMQWIMTEAPEVISGRGGFNPFQGFLSFPLDPG